MYSLILDREETYDPQTQYIWCFKHVDDIVEGMVLNLGNMVSCYHFEVDGVEWRSSEELYLSVEFSCATPEHKMVRKALRAAKSPYAAKRFVKAKYRRLIREDFPEFRTQWMLWCVWQKCMGNECIKREPNDDVIVWTKWILGYLHDSGKTTNFTIREGNFPYPPYHLTS